MTRLRPADAAAAYKSYLRRLSDMLDDQPFLLGAVPTVANPLRLSATPVTYRLPPPPLGNGNSTADSRS